MEEKIDNDKTTQLSQAPNPSERINPPVPEEIGQEHQPDDKNTNGGNGGDNGKSWLARLWDK